jgi:hypothetical protein
MIYGTATYYGHLRFEPPDDDAQAAEIAARRPTEASYLAGLGAALAGAGAGAGGTGDDGSAGGAADGGRGKRGTGAAGAQA